VGLYQKFGFWPRFLTAVMSKPLAQTGRVSGWSRYSEVKQNERDSCLSACRELTNAMYEGLDVGREIRPVDTQKLGDTVLLWDGARLAGLAVCHCGPDTEAGGGSCYVKFGAVRPGPDASQEFSTVSWMPARLKSAKGK